MAEAGFREDGSVPTLTQTRSPGPGLGYTITISHNTVYGEILPGFTPENFELEGPRFARGALDPADCRQETIFPLPGTKPVDLRLQPRDVRRVLSLEQQGPDVKSFVVERCVNKECLESFYDPVQLAWSCERFGAPWSRSSQPTPPGAWFTREDSLESGPRKVLADEFGAPIPLSGQGATGLATAAPWLLLAALGAVLLLGGR